MSAQPSKTGKTLSTETALEAVVEYQEHVRRILEKLLTDSEARVSIEKQLVLLTERVAVLAQDLEAIEHRCLEERARCERVLNGKVTAAKDRIEERLADRRTFEQERFDAVIKKLDSIEARLLATEKEAASMGGRYGAVTSIIVVLVLEVVRWLFQRASLGGHGGG